MEKRGRYVASITSFGAVSGEERIFTRQKSNRRWIKDTKQTYTFPIAALVCRKVFFGVANPAMLKYTCSTYYM